MNKANTVREGMMLLAEKAPHVYYMSGTRIKTMLAERVGSPSPKLFTLADFNQPALDFDMPIACLARGGRPATPIEKRARREAGGARESSSRSRSTSKLVKKGRCINLFDLGAKLHMCKFTI